MKNKGWIAVSNVFVGILLGYSILQAIVVYTSFSKFQSHPSDFLEKHAWPYREFIFFIAFAVSGLIGGSLYFFRLKMGWIISTAMLNTLGIVGLIWFILAGLGSYNVLIILFSLFTFFVGLVGSLAKYSLPVLNRFKINSIPIVIAAILAFCLFVLCLLQVAFSTL